MIPSISFEPLGIVFGSWRPYWLDILCGFVRKLATPFHPLVYHSCSSPCSVPNMTCQKKLPWPAMTWGILPILIILQICLLTSFTMAIHGHPWPFATAQIVPSAPALGSHPQPWTGRRPSEFSQFWCEGSSPKISGNQWMISGWSSFFHFFPLSWQPSFFQLDHFFLMANKWPTLAFLDVSHFGTPLVT